MIADIGNEPENEMEEMNAPADMPVDAVSVLREYSQQHGCPDDFQHAIEAVAELLFYAHRAECRADVHERDPRKIQAFAALRAALANCKPTGETK